MPDISNEDLMKLIHRVITKVDIIEQKLDKLLENKRKASESLEPELYRPIGNSSDLHLVSKKIYHDDDYTANLVS